MVRLSPGVQSKMGRGSTSQLGSSGDGVGRSERQERSHSDRLRCTFRPSSQPYDSNDSHLW